tara:strand:- start:810 stop:926 length:117 start_codon:yes stop_codon:yes gene_type:complete
MEEVGVAGRRRSGGKEAHNLSPCEGALRIAITALVWLI